MPQIDYNENSSTKEDFFSEVVLKFVELPPESDIYDFIGEKLKELIEYGFIVISEYNSDSESFKIKSIFGKTGVVTEIAKKLLKKNLYGITVPMSSLSKNVRENVSKNKLWKVEGGLHEVLGRNIPKKIALMGEKLLNVGEIYNVGFTWKGELYGSANIFMDKGKKFKNLNELKKFVNLASVALQRKVAEDTMVQAKIYNRSLFESSIDPLVTIDINGKITDANIATINTTGFNQEEIIGTNFCEHFTEPGKAAEGYNNVFDQGTLSNFPLELLHVNGNLTPVLCNASVYHDQHGQVKGVFVAARDITDLQKAKHELVASEKKYRSLFDNANDMITLTALKENGLPGKFVEVNNEVINRLGYSREEFLNMGPSDIIVHDNQSEIQHIVAKLESKDHAKFDIIEQSKDGKRIPVELNIHLFELDGKKVSLAISRDITERKRAEADKQRLLEKVQDFAEELKVSNEDLKESTSKLQASNEELQRALNEKEMLIKEIHHRVKNNLMVISSLLNLQSRYIKNKDYLAMFRESQTRAKSMALIHEQLYQSTDLKRINFGEYITSFATNLFQTYAADASRIKLDFDVEDVLLDINIAVPLGLIVNELISNSLKHAFPPGKSGVINIKFYENTNHYELVLKDNGVGFPDNLDYKNTDSLGLRLVNMLTDQIEGKISLDRTSGTSFTINLKEEPII